MAERMTAKIGNCGGRAFARGCVAACGSGASRSQVRGGMRVRAAAGTRGCGPAGGGQREYRGRECALGSGAEALLMKGVVANRGMYMILNPRKAFSGQKRGDVYVILPPHVGHLGGR